MDLTLEAALDASRRAVDFDKNEQYKQAIYYYGVAVKRLKDLSNVPALAEKYTQYQDRIGELQKISELPTVCILFFFCRRLLEHLFTLLF